MVSCYFAYPYIIPGKRQNENAVVINRNDSIYLAKINEAVSLTESEISKKDISNVDETTLCSAAKIYTDANSLDVTDSVKEKGNQMWVSSQQVIDNAYEYLYNKGVEYGEMGAESASRKFSKRSIVLSDYVTPPKRKGSYTPRKGTAKSQDAEKNANSPQWPQASNITRSNEDLMPTRIQDNPITKNK